MERKQNKKVIKEAVKEKIIFYVAMIMLYLTMAIIVPGDLGVKLNATMHVVIAIVVILFGIFMYKMMFKRSESRQ